MLRDDTTIRISKSTKKRFGKLGNLSESWNELLEKVADFLENNEEWEDFEDEEDEEDEEEEKA
jgi:hypothetical protein